MAELTEVASEDGAGAPGGRNPFVNRDYRIWVLGSVFTALGIGLQLVTIPLFIRDRVEPDERGAVIAGALIIQTLPGVVLLLLGGVIADRVEARLIIVVSTAVAAATSLVYVALSVAEVAVVWPVFALSAVIGAVAAFDEPARYSVLPRIVTHGQIQNAVILGSVGVLAAGQFGGPALGGIVGGDVSLTAAFGLEAALLGAGAVIFLAMRRYEPVPSESHSIRDDIVAGLRYVRRSRAIMGLLALSAMPGVFFLGPLFVNMLLIVEDVLILEDRWVGILLAIFGAGMVVSSVLMTLVPLPRRGLLLVLSSIVVAPLLVVYGLSTSVALTVAALILTGPPAAIFTNLSLALLQERTEQAMMGRVMGLYNLMFVAAAPIGYGITGITTSLWGPQVSVVACSVAGGVAGVALLIWLPVRKLR